MIHFTFAATTLLAWGIVAHLFCDWLLQNEWMADNKANLRHRAGYVHAMIHVAGLLLVFKPLAAVVIGVVHLLIDTRVPLKWWRGVYRQTSDPANPISLHVALWGDQVLHIVVIAVAAFTCGR